MPDFPLVPVVVVGADTPTGRAVVEALLAEGVPDLRATVATRAGQRELVPLGVRTALVEPENADHLASVLQDAHTAVLTGPVPLPVVAAACADAGIALLVVVGESRPPEASYDVVLVADGPDAPAAVVAADRAAR